MAEVVLERVCKSYDGQTLAVRDLNLSVGQGQMLALLGPSGCGKSSTLKMVAGIEPITSGRILFDGVDVSQRDSAGRNVAMVFEDYSLYPHMSTYENMAFPLRVRGVSKAEVKRKVDEVVALLGLQPLLNEPVRALSGGAQQRVSIGRALVRDPALMMFDEPLSHLDADQKVILRTEIRRLQTTAGLTSVLVTHDQTEAMAMADQIAVMSDGLLQQVGSPKALYEHPVNRFVAGFIGDSPMNFFDAALQDDGTVRIRGASSGLHLAASARATHSAASARATHPLIVVGIRPEHVELDGAEAQAEAARPSITMAVEVIDRECCGDRDVLLVQSEAGRFSVELPSPCSMRAGDRITARLHADRLHVFDAETGIALRVAEAVW
jgi:multiple sugar transport system ATP-binding protein